MADQHIEQITCDPGAENEFAIADKWFIDTYVANDWNGAKWYSDTPGTAVEIVAPVVAGGIHVSNSEWKDINNTGATIYADDGTNVDGGGNTGIEFPAVVGGNSGKNFFFFNGQK